MNHSFNVEIAEKYGLHEAIILENIFFWVEKNRANKRNFHNGRYWTYNSAKALSILFPYMSEDIIFRTIKSLRESGLILTDNLNENPMDRTLWYSLPDFVMSFWRNEHRNSAESEAPVKTFINDCELNNNNKNHDTAKLGNAYRNSVESHTYINNTDINIDTYIKSRDKSLRSLKFKPPTLEELTKYCKEKGYQIDCESFIAFYASKGWMIGKNKMKDWRCCVVTWARRSGQKSEPRRLKSHEIQY